MDRTHPCGGCNVGSIPTGSTQDTKRLPAQAFCAMCAGRSDVSLASETARQGRAAICATAQIERLTTKHTRPALRQVLWFCAGRSDVRRARRTANRDLRPSFATAKRELWATVCWLVYLESAAVRLVRRDFMRAAVFFLMVPFFAALSIVW